jgi:hypothetical protein
MVVTDVNTSTIDELKVVHVEDIEKIGTKEVTS